MGILASQLELPHIIMKTTLAIRHFPRVIRQGISRGLGNGLSPDRWLANFFPLCFVLEGEAAGHLQAQAVACTLDGKNAATHSRSGSGPFCV